MEEQIPASNVSQPQPAVPGAPYGINQLTPEMLDALKAQARQNAIKQVIEERAASYQAPAPQVVYLRRNLTVAELGLILLLSCGIVTGIQAAWNFGSNLLPRIEIKVK
jgi:hypothetical protein